jgi:hypothetical protein
MWVFFLKEIILQGNKIYIKNVLIEEGGERS